MISQNDIYDIKLGVNYQIINKTVWGKFGLLFFFFLLYRLCLSILWLLITVNHL